MPAGAFDERVERQFEAHQGTGGPAAGLTDDSQSFLVGDVDAGEAFGSVESVKAASDIYSPLSGEIIEINESLTDAPETVNSDPYVDGWFFRLQPAEPGELESLLDSEHYSESIEE